MKVRILKFHFVYVLLGFYKTFRWSYYEPLTWFMVSKLNQIDLYVVGLFVLLQEQMKTV